MTVNATGSGRFHYAGFGTNVQGELKLVVAVEDIEMEGLLCTYATQPWPRNGEEKQSHFASRSGGEKKSELVGSSSSLRLLARHALARKERSSAGR